MSKKKYNDADAAEFISNLKIIFGDKWDKLEDPVVDQLINTWRTNPDFIKNAAELKKETKLEPIKLESIKLESSNRDFGKQKETTQETAIDDLRPIKSFKKAFAEARKRGLKLFRWNKSIYTTKLAKNKPISKLANNGLPAPPKLPYPEVFEELLVSDPEIMMHSPEINPYILYSLETRIPLIYTPSFRMSSTFIPRTFNDVINNGYNRYVDWRTEFKRPKIEKLPPLALD